jgi:hypothetical protein
METIAQNADARSNPRSPSTDWAFLAFWASYFALIAGFAITVF